MEQFNIPDVLTVLRTETDPQLIRSVTTILCDLSFQEAYAYDVRDVDLFLGLLEDHNNTVKSNILALLENSMEKNSDALRDLDAAAVLMKLLSCPSEQIQCQVVTLLCKLVSSCQLDTQLLLRTVPVLTSLVLSTTLEVLISSLWAITYVSSISEAAVKMIIDNRLLKKLILLIKDDAPVIQIPALEAIGNVFSIRAENQRRIAYLSYLSPEVPREGKASPSSPSRVNISANHDKLTVSYGLLYYLLQALASPSQDVVRLSCLVLSKITAGSRFQLRAVILSKILPALHTLLRYNKDVEIRVNCTAALCNAISGASDEQLSCLLTGDMWELLRESLRSEDARFVGPAVVAVKSILLAGDRHGKNPYRAVIRSGHLVSLLKKVSYMNEEAAEIMASYFTISSPLPSPGTNKNMRQEVAPLSL